jgi:hypothetical protein
MQHEVVNLLIVKIVGGSKAQTSFNPLQKREGQQKDFYFLFWSLFYLQPKSLVTMPKSVQSWMTLAGIPACNHETYEF